MDGWQSDPTGRHEERRVEGGAWTAVVRDRGIENRDEVGWKQLAPTTPTAPAPVAPPWPVGPGAEPLVPAYGLAPSAAPAGPALPGYGPPPSAVTAATATKASRKGLPLLLALSVVFAAFPAVLLAGMGTLAVMAGADISDASETGDWNYTESTGGYDEYGNYDGYGDYDQYGDYVGYSPGTEDFVADDDGTFSDDLDRFGENTSGTGVVLLGVGTAMLVAALLTAAGNNAGRVITAIWLVLATGYLLYAASEAPSGVQAYVAVFLAPPIIAIVGLFTPSSNRLFKA